MKDAHAILRLISERFCDWDRWHARLFEGLGPWLAVSLLVSLGVALIKGLERHAIHAVVNLGQRRVMFETVGRVDVVQSGLGKLRPTIAPVYHLATVGCSVSVNFGLLKKVVVLIEHFHASSVVHGRLAWHLEGWGHLQVGPLELFGSLWTEHLHHEEDDVGDVALDELVHKTGPLDLVEHGVNLVCLGPHVLENVVNFLSVKHLLSFC